MMRPLLFAEACTAEATDSAFLSGNTLAQAEVPLLLAAIVQKFQLKLVPGHRVATAPSLTLRPLKGIRVTLKKR
jgi:cytochrome P450